MNEEEKYAIEDIKEIIELYEDDCLLTTGEDIEYMKIILNLIDKQQKEIEQMKTKINKIVLMIKENYNGDFYDDYETIAGLRDDIYNLLTKKI